MIRSQTHRPEYFLCIFTRRAPATNGESTSRRRLLAPGEKTYRLE